MEGEDKKGKQKNIRKEALIFKIVIISTIISIVISSVLGMTFGFLASNFNFKNFFDLELKNEKLLSEEGDSGLEVFDQSLSLAQEDVAVINAVEKSSPSVVSIIVTKDIPKLDSFFLDPFLNDPFFNPFGYETEDDLDTGTEKREIGGGTGFIVDSEGYILTNRHVVNDEEAEYTVMMNDGEKIEAEVLAKDDFMDVAILKIKSDKKLSVVQLGDSDALKIGQTVIAIGNSLGEFRNTVSKGIISGLKRNLDASDGRGKSEALEEVVQTDAAVNPGNSGGPLLNLRGQVIGINVAMAQGAENIAFSIPINQVKEIYRAVKETGKISRPYLGVRYVLNNKQIASENKLSFDYGALVVRGERISDLAIIPGSPADKAGLQENDIILEIDKQKINQENDITKMIRKNKVGDTINLKVWSKGKEKAIVVVLEESQK